MSHYLEVNDSVRSAWSLPDDVKADAYLQAWAETLFALAFGRDVVVPATFVFDSLACQRVLADVSAAYHETSRLNPRFWAGRPRPVRLHLHASTSFGHTAADIVERVLAQEHDDLVPPFHSSLYPDLRQRVTDPARLIDQLRAGTEVCDLTDVFGDDERGELFRGAWDWCRGASPRAALRVVASEPLSHASLQSCVHAMLTSDVDTALRALPPSEADTLDRTIRALRRLAAKARTDSPFDQRSRLRHQWPWSEDGQTAEELVGEDDLGLVREVVDTLYNRVVARSIGEVSASFSTSFATGSRVSELFLAQGLGIHGLATEHTAGDREGGVAGAGPGTLELTIDAHDQSARGRATAGLDRESAVRTLVTVLTAQTSSRWAGSVEAMAAAQRAGDTLRMQDAVAHHCDLLAELMGDGWEHRAGAGGGLKVQLAKLSRAKAAAAAGGASVASNSISMVAGASPAWLLAMAGLSAAGGVLAAGAWQHRSMSRHRRAFRAAMSEIVSVRQVGR